MESAGKTTEELPGNVRACHYVNFDQIRMYPRLFLKRKIIKANRQKRKVFNMYFFWVVISGLLL